MSPDVAEDEDDHSGAWNIKEEAKVLMANRAVKKEID